MSTYNPLIAVRGSWKIFRDAARRGSHSLETKEEKRYLLRNLEKYIHTYKSEHHHVTGRGFAREIDPISYRNLEKVIRRYYGSFFDFMVESGVWDGEPLVEKTVDINSVTRKLLISENYPEVVFSRTGGDSDISWFPKLPDAYSGEVGEVTGALMTSGFRPAIQSASENRLQIVNYMGLKVDPREIIYLTRYLIPLFARTFNVHQDFFQFLGVGKERGIYSEFNLPQYHIFSQMIGSYFQNIVGIYDVHNGVVRKGNPKIQVNKEGWVKGVLNTTGTTEKSQILLLGEKLVLDLFKETALDLDCSEPRPRFQYPLTQVSRKNDRLYANHVRSYSLGTDAFTKDGRFVGKVVDFVRDKRWEEEGIPDQLVIQLENDVDLEKPLFPVTHYHLSIRGGQEVVRGLVERYFVNPYRILRYLEKLRNVPKNASADTKIQELVLATWKGDVGSLLKDLREYYMSIDPMRRFYRSVADSGSRDVDETPNMRRLKALIYFRIRSSGYYYPNRDLRWAYKLVKPTIETRLKYRRCLDPDNIAKEKPELADILKSPIYDRIISVILDVLKINFRDYFLKSHNSLAEVTAWERKMLEKVGWEIIEGPERSLFTLKRKSDAENL